MQKWCLTILKQEGLAVASIARDDPSPLPGMHRDHNASACTASLHALRLTVHVGARGKFGSEFETEIIYNAPMHFCHRQMDGQTDRRMHTDIVT